MKGEAIHRRNRQPPCRDPHHIFPHAACATQCRSEPRQLKAMAAIEACRTAELGGHVARCEDCAHTIISYNSCNIILQWLAEREAELLPLPYYHVVFTLPAAIGAIAWQNKAEVYHLLFKAASETMLTIAADPSHLGARIGMTAVLHTWGSALTHHPHVHMIVPGGDWHVRF